MVHKANPRDLAVLAGGFVQGRFSSMGGAGGIDLHIVTDESGVHGKYENYDFSLYLSEELNHLKFRFEMKVPPIPEPYEEGHSYAQLSRLIGETLIEQKKDVYIARGVIRKHSQQIRSANEILNDLWNYVIKEPFSKVQRSRKN